MVFIILLTVWGIADALKSLTSKVDSLKTAVEAIKK